ncbi:hypothetical protein BT67DRAFT_444741, partial [Trichocladium antarcticum]
CSRVGCVAGSWVWPRGLRCRELGVAARELGTAGWAALPGARYGQVGYVARSWVQPR